MNSLATLVCACVLCAAAVHSMDASAVCLDPKDPSKYHYPSLESEAAAVHAIVIGSVVRVQPLSEDSSDPGGWTAFLYTIRVAESLRGQLTGDITLRAENDSAGYRMELGESHLLFLHQRKEGFSVDPCGKSTELSKGNDVLKQMRLLLAK